MLQGLARPRPVRHGGLLGSPATGGKRDRVTGAPTEPFTRPAAAARQPSPSRLIPAATRCAFASSHHQVSR